MSNWPPSFSTLTFPAGSTETWPRLGASRWSAAPTKSGAAPRVRISEATAKRAPHFRALRVRFMLVMHPQVDPRAWVGPMAAASGLGVRSAKQACSSSGCGTSFRLGRPGSLAAAMRRCRFRVQSGVVRAYPASASVGAGRGASAQQIGRPRGLPYLPPIAVARASQPDAPTRSAKAMAWASPGVRRSARSAPTRRTSAA